MIELKTDLHLHTCDDREDYINHTAHELIDMAAQRGFHVLAITNHNTYTFDHELRNYALDKGILLIPGIEKTIEGKHVLILNANPAAEKINTFYDLRKAKEDEIFVIAPHPFFKVANCLEKKLLQNLELFDAIEYCFFYSKRINFNSRAAALAKEYGLPMVGNSDCHLLKYLGICHSIIYAESQTLQDVLTAIRNKYVEVISRPIFLPKLCAIFCNMTTNKYRIKRQRRKVTAISQEKIIKESYFCDA